MPQLKYYTPESLEDLCMSAVMRSLETDLLMCEIAKGFIPTSLVLRHLDLSVAHLARDLTEYMSYLPGTMSEMVRQEVTRRVIKRYTSAASSQNKRTYRLHGFPLYTITLRFLEVVLNEDVHIFDLSELDPSTCPQPLRPKRRDPELWELLLNCCTGLRKLILPSSLRKCFQADIESFIALLAPQCNQLTEVIIKDAVQDDKRKVLSALGECCPNLRVLDVTGSLIVCTDVLYLIFPKLTEDQYAGFRLKYKKDILPDVPTGLSQSFLCSKLRELIVSDTNIRSLGVYYALRYFPNLESLGVCYSVGNGIRKLFQEGWPNFNLKRAYTTGLTKYNMKLICSMCPKLETLFIGSGGVDTFKFKFSSLCKLLHLRFLTLESSRALDLTGLKCASQLTELKLQVPDVDVGQIAHGCPALTRLTITKKPKNTVTISSRHKQKLFKSLQELKVDCPISKGVGALILREATFLKVFKCVRIKKLSDGILRAVLEKNPLQFLETWLLTYSHLTIESVDLLLRSCPNLSRLGRLSGWDIRSWESRRLCKVWRKYEISIVLFSHEQKDVPQIMDATASSDDDDDDDEDDEEQE